MSGRKPKPPREELERMYLEEDKTKEEIKKIYSVSHATLKNWFEEYEITSRNLSEAQILSKSKWETEKEWSQYGLDRDYDKRSPASLSESEDISGGVN